MNASKLSITLAAGLGLLPALRAGQAEPALVWDSVVKEIHAPADLGIAHVSFSVTNVSHAAVIIQEVRPSCGCTLVSLPAQPWKLLPGASGTVKAEVDLSLKSGLVVNTLSVITSAGPTNLIFKAHLAERASAGWNLAERVRRLREQQALPDSGQLPTANPAPPTNAPSPKQQRIVKDTGEQL